MGVGSYLRGDDSAGLRVARRLRRAGLRDVLVLECSTAPEGFTDKVRGFEADHVVIVDAVHAGLAPGDVMVLEPSQLSGQAWDTHRPSLRLLALYLKQELGVESTFIGIQAKELGLTLGSRVSREVARAVGALANAMEAAFERLGFAKASRAT